MVGPDQCAAIKDPKQSRRARTTYRAFWERGFTNEASAMHPSTAGRWLCAVSGKCSLRGHQIGAGRGPSPSGGGGRWSSPSWPQSFRPQDLCE